MGDGPCATETTVAGAAAYAMDIIFNRLKRTRQQTYARGDGGNGENEAA